MVGRVEVGVVEGKKDSWLREPRDSVSYLGVGGRDNGRGGAASLGTARRLNVDVGGIEIGEGGRFWSGGGGSSVDIDDSSFHVRDSGGSVAVKVNLVSSEFVGGGGLSAKVTASLRLLASSWASLRVVLEPE